MSQIIYEIINSPAFWFVAVLWLLICIAWKSKRDPLLTRSADLISKPVVFEKDLHPDSYRFYSRLNMETLARVFKNALVLPFAGIIVQFRTWIQAQVDIVYRRDRPLRLLGYVIYLTTFLLFVWADAIAIVNTLATLDLLSGTVPDFLTQFDIAVAMGSLGAVIVAGLVMMDVHGDTSRFSDWEDHREGTFWKEFAKRATRIMLALAFIVVFTFGLQRLTIFQPAYTSSGLVKLFIDAVLLIVVPINTVLTTMLIAPEAFLGLFLLIILIQVILLGLVIVINYLVTLLAYIFPFMVDTIYRIVLLILDLLFYIILTPIELLIQLIMAPFGGGRPNQPAYVQLVDDLSLRTESGNWPPQAGEKIIAHIKIRNGGNLLLHIEHLGVRGRRNGSEFWDINFLTIDLNGHQEWSLDPNNERPLVPGNYSFRISYSLDGSNWTEIGNEINFSVP